MRSIVATALMALAAASCGGGNSGDELRHWVHVRRQVVKQCCHMIGNISTRCPLGRDGVNLKNRNVSNTNRNGQRNSPAPATECRQCITTTRCLQAAVPRRQAPSAVSPGTRECCSRGSECPPLHQARLFRIRATSCCACRRISEREGSFQRKCSNT